MRRWTEKERAIASKQMSREQLYDVYITQNKTRDECAEYFECSVATIRKYLKIHDIVKPQELINEMCKRRMLEKYGVPYSILNKDSREKYKETCLKKYNSEYAISSDTVKDKIKDTMLDRYGVENAFSSDEVKAKIKQYYVDHPDKLIEMNERRQATNLKLYGVCNVFSNKDIRTKINKTRIERYGSYNNTLASHLDELKDKESLLNFIKDKNYTYTDLSKLLNISYVSAINYIHEYELEGYIKEYKSQGEVDIYNYIKSIYDGEVIQNDRTILKPKELDIYIPDKNLAIEYNGTFWHSDIYKDANYHYDKSVSCEEHGIRLIHIWEYEWNNERQRPILENIIKGALGLNETIYARKCNIVIRQSKDMTEFFNKNNIQGFRGGKFAVCLEYNNEIVMSYIFGSAFFGKGKYEYEVIRGATKLGYNVVGGASRIWKYFINEYKPKSCVYYVDYNYFNGSSLLNLEGMKFIKTQKSYKNYWIEDDTVRNRDPIHNAEINKLYKEGLVIKLYNAGTKLYVWTNDEN